MRCLSHESLLESVDLHELSVSLDETAEQRIATLELQFLRSQLESERDSKRALLQQLHALQSQLTEVSGSKNKFIMVFGGADLDS